MRRGILSISCICFCLVLIISGVIAWSPNPPSGLLPECESVTVKGSNVILPVSYDAVLNEGELVYDNGNLITSKQSKINNIDVSSNVQLGQGDLSESGSRTFMEKIRDTISSLFLILPLTGRVVENIEINLDNTNESFPVSAILTKPLPQEALSDTIKLNQNYYLVGKVPLRTGDNPNSSIYLVGANSHINFNSGNRVIDLGSGDKVSLEVNSGGATFLENREEDISLAEIVKSGGVRTNSYLVRSDNANLNLDIEVLFEKFYGKAIPMEINAYSFNSSQSFETIFSSDRGNNGKIIINSNGELYLVNEDVKVDKNGEIDYTEDSSITSYVIRNIKGQITGFVSMNTHITFFDWDQVDNKWFGIVDRRNLS